jgi:hypothetical protein
VLPNLRFDNRLVLSRMDFLLVLDLAPINDIGQQMMQASLGKEDHLLPLVRVEFRGQADTIILNMDKHGWVYSRGVRERQAREVDYGTIFTLFLKPLPDGGGHRLLIRLRTL